MTLERLRQIVKILNVRIVHGEFQLLGDTRNYLAFEDEEKVKWAMEIVDSPIGLEGAALFEELAEAGLINDYAASDGVEHD